MLFAMLHYYSKSDIQKPSELKTIFFNNVWDIKSADRLSINQFRLRHRKQLIYDQNGFFPLSQHYRGRKQKRKNRSSIG